MFSSQWRSPINDVLETMTYSMQWRSSTNDVLQSMTFFKQWRSSINDVLQSIPFFNQWRSPTNDVLQPMTFFNKIDNTLVAKYHPKDYFFWCWRYLTRVHIWHLSQSSIRPSIYFSSFVKSGSNPFLEPTSTKQ